MIKLVTTKVRAFKWRTDIYIDGDKYSLYGRTKRGSLYEAYAFKNWMELNAAWDEDTHE